MKTISKFISVAIVALFLGACSSNIVGTWSVAKYESIISTENDVKLTNIGTMTFSKNGEGAKSIKYSLLGKDVEDNKPFTWKLADGIITIAGEGTDFAKAWILVENKSNKLVWKSTDGANQVQILELIK